MIGQCFEGHWKTVWGPDFELQENEKQATLKQLNCKILQSLERLKKSENETKT